MDNSAVRSDSNVIYGETYMVTLINSTKYYKSVPWSYLRIGVRYTKKSHLGAKVLLKEHNFYFM